MSLKASSLATLSKNLEGLNPEALAALPPDDLQALLEELGPEGCLKLKYEWSFWARPNQLEPEGEWSTWLLNAGRGFGKTRVGAETIRSWVETGRCKRLALVAEDAGDARDVMVEGESGILAVSPPWFKPHYEPSKRRLTWPNGATATLFSSDDPESLRGPQFDGAWCDELAKWRYAQATWDMLMFGLRLGTDPRLVVTTTPRPTALMRELLGRKMNLTEEERRKKELKRLGKERSEEDDEGDVYVTGGSTMDNKANLAKKFMKNIVKKYAGTRLGRQELEAELLEDTPGALWKLSELDKMRSLDGIPEELDRVVVAVDPPVSVGEDADECGIIAAGRGRSGRIYILGDYSCQGETPSGWAEKAQRAANLHLAGTIVAEANQGGEMVRTTLIASGTTCKVRLVHASKGKVTRAEPISALYEQGRVSHLGSFAKLEDQMCAFTSNFDRAKMGYSPDRVDALVWAVTELEPSLGQDAEVRIRTL